jgi:hypothetical protein
MPAGQLAQDLVSGTMAEAIVDRLEPVDVEVDDAKRLACAPCARELGGERGLEAAPVEKAGEAIGARQRFERASIATHAPDQRHDHQPAADLGEPARRRGRERPVLDPVGEDRHRDERVQPKQGSHAAEQRRRARHASVGATDGKPAPASRGRPVAEG